MPLYATIYHMREFTFYITNAEEINKRYGGKHIAIVGNKVVASGTDPKEVWEETKKKRPNKKERSGILGDILRPVVQVEIKIRKKLLVPHHNVHRLRS